MRLVPVVPLVSKTIQLIDRYSHHKKIFEALSTAEIKTCINIGAHHGELLAFLGSIPSMECIHAFEPNPQSFQILTDTLNGHLASAAKPEVILNNAALSNVSGTKPFYMNTLSQSSSLEVKQRRSVWSVVRGCILLSTHTEYAPISVETETLDRYLMENQIDQIDLITIDVEGHELSVLQGASHALQSAKWVLIEKSLTNLHKNYDFEQCHELLNAHHFTMTDRFVFPFFGHFADLLYTKN